MPVSLQVGKFYVELSSQKHSFKFYKTKLFNSCLHTVNQHFFSIGESYKNSFPAPSKYLKIVDKYLWQIFVTDIFRIR